MPASFGGTAAEVVLNVHRKREEYDRLRVEEKNVLRAVKLLYSGWIFEPKLRHVRLTWENLFGNGGDWYACINSLEEREFIKVHGERVRIPVVYLLKVIHDYPPSIGDLKRHLDNLSDLLFKENAYMEVFMLGVAFFAGLKDHSKAIMNCSKAIALRPDYAEAYGIRGSAYFKLGMYEEAAADCSRAIAIKPDLAEAYSSRRYTYVRLEMHEEAAADYSRAIALRPDYTEAYNNRGNAYGELGMYEEAAADYSRAIAIKPDLAEAYNNRGYTYFKLGMYGEAVADLEVCWRLRSSLPDKGARVPLLALLILSSMGERGIVFQLWFDRALEVYDLLPPEARRVVWELTLN